MDVQSVSLKKVKRSFNRPICILQPLQCEHTVSFSVQYIIQVGRKKKKEREKKNQ